MGEPIRRTIVRVALAVALIGLGWSIGRAQSADPDFELVVDAPTGEVTVTCAKGCALAWVERGVNPNATPQQTFTYGCSGGTNARCGSGKVGGWLRR